MDEVSARDKWLGLALRVGLYAFLCLLGVLLMPNVLAVFGYLVAAALGTFSAGAIANTVAIRIFERGSLVDIGLRWSPAARRNLFGGFVAGGASAVAVLALPILAGAARLERDAAQPASLGALVFVSVLLLFGAIGEEMIFRGYGFQTLVRELGPFATILPVAVLFAMAHSGNAGASLIGLINTGAFGVVFGYAYVRSGDLWLPIGLHYGWNWVLPLFGVRLSGFEMGVSGYKIVWTGSDWWSGGAYGPEASLVTCVVVVVLFVGLVKARFGPDDDGERLLS